jgi:hypothetical protein
MRRSIVAVLVVSLIAGGLFVAAPPVGASPVATSQEEYTAYNRIFPDPHGCQARTAPYSPFAKGQVCAADFLQFAELEGGLAFLEESFPRFVKVYKLHEDFNCQGKPVSNPDAGCTDFRSAGLPQTLPDGQSGGFSRDRQPLYMVRITDESVPIKGKKHFVFPLSIHGIERAGAEGGTRAAEDLATWGACEAEVAPDYVNCEHADNVAPHPLLEATPEKSVTAGEALRKSAVFMIYPNPDGWRRGERTEGTQSFMRYNGNGVDLNRDWPAQGFTFRPYTPWSEPESKAFGRALQGVGPTDKKGNPKWTGGIDLHGQLVDRAFSFTLIGGSERPYDKNQRVMQTVKGAWKDAEARLAWSPLIKPNDAAADDPRVYGVQYGTIWDTIAYTVTGALGDWIDSPIGLNADGIDNEMSLSHLSNCGTGSCWSPDVEQLHVDGNKSLIYAMINYSLKRESKTFKTKGRVGYIHNRGFVKEKTDRTTTPPKYTNLPTQEDIPGVQLTQQNSWTHEFDVKGPKQDIYNGGIAVTLTCANLQGTGTCSLTQAQLQRQNKGREGEEGEWETVNSYFNQGVGYNQAGQALHANYPEPGKWRVIIDGATPIDVFTGDIDFTPEAGWPDPGQIGYKVSSMRFWKMLKKYTKPKLGKVTAGQIESGNRWKKRYDTIVMTNRVYKGIAPELKKWVKKGGNLVLTDKAIKMLPRMKLTKGKGVVNKQDFYAGYINFATAAKEVTYDDPLSKKINLPGAAEGQGGDEVHRRQTYEPVPLGIAIQSADGGDSNNSPIWAVSSAAWDKIKKSRAVGTSGGTDRVSYGEIKLKKGRIRIIGALLPNPTEKFDHPFGLGNYALTYAGYQVLNNSLSWKR